MKGFFVERVPRIEGLLRVVQARVEQEQSLLLQSGRSLQTENSLVGRYPLEAIQTTQAISESAGVAHGLAAVAALESYLQITPTLAASQMRHVMFKLSTLRAHILHFYFELLPDYLNRDHYRSSNAFTHLQRFDVSPRKKVNGDLSLNAGNAILKHIARASEAIALLQQSLTLVGGKYPIIMNLIPGGLTNFRIDRPLIMRLIRNLELARDFVETVWPEDVKLFIQDLPDTVSVPVRSANLISFGSIPTRKQQEIDIIYTEGVFVNGKLGPVSDLLINESLDNTYYLPVRKKRNPQARDFDLEREGARTWIKGARYDNEPMLTGALARIMITHFAGSNLEISDYVGRMIEDLGLSVESPNCVASRLLAEVFEARFYIKATMKLLLDFQIGQPLNHRIPLDFSGKGAGIGKVEAPGGALLHQTFLDENRILQYRIISAANWNFSTADSNGKSGIVEAELNALTEKKELSALQIHRIVHSYNAQILDGVQ